jgi:hypothetical protein
MRFDWDPANDEWNRQERGFGFDFAALIFLLYLPFQSGEPVFDGQRAPAHHDRVLEQEALGVLEVCLERADLVEHALEPVVHTGHHFGERRLGFVIHVGTSTSSITADGPGGI